jgi:Flp pilus assembly protein TadD
MRMLLSIPSRLWAGAGRRSACVAALGLLLASCTEPAQRLASPLAPPDPPAVSAPRDQPARVDLAPLAAVHKARPADPDAALAYARGLREAGSARQALAVLDKASARAPADKRLLLERGLLTLELGEPAKAEPLLRKAEDKTAPDWRLHSGLGTALAARGKQLDAQVEFARALELAPDHPSLLNNLALSYALDGKAEQAEQLLRKAHRAKSAAAARKVQQNLALVLGLRGKHEESRTAAAGTLTAAKAQRNAAYLRELSDARAAHASAERNPAPATETPARRASATLPQPIFGLGGPSPASE